MDSPLGRGSERSPGRKAEDDVDGLGLGRCGHGRENAFLEYTATPRNVRSFFAARPGRRFAAAVPPVLEWPRLPVGLSRSPCPAARQWGTVVREDPHAVTESSPFP